MRRRMPRLPLRVALAALAALLVLPALHGGAHGHAQPVAFDATGSPSAVVTAAAPAGASLGAPACRLCRAVSQARGLFVHGKGPRTPSDPARRALPRPAAVSPPQFREAASASPRAPPVPA